MLFVETWILVSAIGFGALVGSFLNVVILRLPQGRTVTRGRSHCPKCNATIAWYDNVPVVSWLVLRGKCRKCGTSISVRYAMVETLAAVATGYLAYRVLIVDGVRAEGLESFWYPTAMVFAVQVTFVYALIAATFIDLDHTIIPDEITKPGMVLGVAAGIAVPQLHQTTSSLEGGGLALLGLLAGAGFIWAVRIGGRFVFRKEAMGFGDVKYMGLIGSILGWEGVVMTFFLACVIGSVIGIFVLVVKKSRYIPFAPFLSAGAAIMLFFSDEVWTFLREDYPAFIQRLIGG